MVISNNSKYKPLTKNLKIKLLKPKKNIKNNPLFIYLPGMDGTGKLFSHQSDRLLPFYNLRYLSIPSDDKSNWEELTQKTVALIKEELNLNNQNKIILCGESFGGCLALKIAITIPSLIKQLILVNPASSFDRRPILSLGIPLTSWIPDWLNKTSAIGLLPFLAELSRLKKEDRLALLDAMKSLPAKVVSWRLSLLKDFAIPNSKLHNFQVQTLIIASICDRLLPSVSEGRRLNELIPNSRLEVLTRSGHACLLETETNLADILQKNNFI